MVERKNKAGRFSTKNKTVFQSDIRLDKLNALKQKDSSSLSKFDKKLVNASQALSASRSSYNKGGRFSNKNTRIKANAQQSPANNSFDGNLAAALNQSTSISVAGFTNNNSVTGVLSQKDVTAGVNTFVDTLKKTNNVNDVKVETDINNKIVGVDVFKDFQKADFNFNASKLTFDTKGWDLDIPEEYIKVGENKYIAPTAKYTSRYKYKRTDDDKDKDYSYGSYNPVEIFLNDEGDQLSKVLKRDVYTKRDKYESDDDSRERRYEKDVYTSEIQNYFDNGLMEQQRLWDDYTIREEQERDEDRREDLEIGGIYLKEQRDFNRQGYLTTQQRWNPYTSREEEGNKGSKTYEEEEQKIAVRDIQYFDDLGRKQAQYEYDDYRSDADVDVAYFKHNESGKKMSAREQRDLYAKFRKNTATQADADKLNAYTFVDKNSLEEEYDVALRKITFYDPTTGQVIQNERLW
jgi:hypothetical protein